MPVTLIDTLLVFHGQEARFLDLWDTFLAGLREKSGFLSGRLMQALAGPTLTQCAPFTHVSLVSFSDDTRCAAALRDPDMVDRVNDLRSVCLISPGLFAPVRSINKFDS